MTDNKDIQPVWVVTGVKIFIIKKMSDSTTTGHATVNCVFLDELDARRAQDKMYHKGWDSVKVECIKPGRIGIEFESECPPCL